MSVLIKGVEIPTEGYIDVRIKCNGTASLAIADNPYIKAVEAVTVPPHGRLIDADAFIKRMTKLVKRAEEEDFALGAAWYETFIRHIEITPTAIEAEGGK